MKLLNIKTVAASLALVSLAFGFNACSPEDAYVDNGLRNDLQATFTVEPIAGRANYYVVKNTTAGAMLIKWDLDKGAGYAAGKEVDTVFYPDAGAYTIKMQAMGKGGAFFDAAPTVVNVPVSDPKAGNLVQGGKFSDATDEAKWTKFTISAGVSWTLTNGKMVAAGGGWGHAGIYQAIQVEANKKYKLGMIVSGSGASDTWFEVYLGKTQPSNGNDYGNGGNLMGLNTWTPCGNSPFNGNLNSIGCTGSLIGKNGEITFTESGTVYLVIKTGGANLGTSGIALDNVEFRGS